MPYLTVIYNCTTVCAHSTACPFNSFCICLYFTL